MRVTQSMITRNYLKNLGRNLRNLSASNEKLTSGRSFVKLSENVCAGSQALKVRSQLKRNEQYLVNIENAQDELSSAESNLNSINDILKTVLEKTIRGMSDTTSASGRQIIAQEIGNLRDQVVQLANAQYADKYLFSGTNNVTAPFTMGSDGRALYNGIPVDEIYKNGAEYYDGSDVPVPQDKDVYIDIGMGIQLSGGAVDPTTGFKLSFSGLDILGAGTDALGIPNNICNLLGDLAGAFSPNYDEQNVKDYYAKIQTQKDAFVLNITDLGTKSNFLEKAALRAENDIANLTRHRSNLEAVDDTTEAMNMKMFEYSWLATLQLGSKILPPSLMDFIS